MSGLPGSHNNNQGPANYIWVLKGISSAEARNGVVRTIDRNHFILSPSLSLLAHLDPGEGGLSPGPGEDGRDGVLYLLDDRTQNIQLASGLIIETELRQSRLTGAWL